MNEILKTGKLVYIYNTDRFDILFDNGDYYGGLHCGECFDVLINGEWLPTRIEMGNDWYLVGLKEYDLQHLEVRKYL
jgi:hypothetical protein